MDYDQTDIPEGYDKGRDHGPEVLDLWLDAIARRVEGLSVARILDLGCGTGRFSQGLADRFRADVVGLDPSTKMLQQARAKPNDGRVHFQLGEAEAIPLPDQAVDLILVSMSFHHFTDRFRAARECRRVLRDGGRVVIRTGTREQIGSYPYVPFFPTIPPLLEEVLPDLATLRGVFEGAGFVLVSSEVIQQTIAPDWATFASKLAAGGDSVLARLAREEFEAGLARVRSHHAAGDVQAVVEPVDLLVFRPLSVSGPRA